MGRILCIDDYPVILEAVKLVLEQAGHEVTAISGAAAEELDLTSMSIDAVVLDFRMPRMDGGRLAKRLKQARPTLPIIMLSAYPEDIPEEVAGAVDVFLAKGTGTARELLASLAELLPKTHAADSGAVAVGGLRRATANALRLDDTVVSKWESH